MEHYDIAVAYRIYPGIGKPLAIFNNDKLKLVEFAFKSFLYSLGNLKISLFVILDTCPQKYKEIVLSNAPTAKIIELNKAGNFKTFEMQIELLLSQTASDVVYFAEDDYCYLPNALETALNFFLAQKPNFLTLYYHPDYLNWEIHNLSEKQEIAFQDILWQKVGSTTLTFLTNKENLQKAKKVFLTFGKKNYDSSLWFSLTKLGVFNPKFPLLPFVSKRKKFYTKMIGKMLIYNLKQTLFGPQFSLFAPIPSLATHLEKDSLAPNIQWNSYFNELIKKLNID
ncbi:MAG: glycosyltransferase family 2 protein [Ignavibacteria bacterium]|nr:glycosyltransferase family 2 protein [Ignavibacteria bacterium]